MPSPAPSRHPVDGPRAVYGIRRRRLQAEHLARWQASIEEDDEPSAFSIFGPCPDCNHDTADVFFTERAVVEQGASPALLVSVAATVYVLTAAPAHIGFPIVDWVSNRIRRRKPDQRMREYVTEVRCSCVTEHGGELDAFGCGARFLLGAARIRSSSSATLVLHAIPESDEPHVWPQAREQRDAAPASLSVVQASAAKWQTALAALLAVLGVSSAIGGRDVVQALEPGFQLLIVLTALVALIGTAIGIWSATQVAAGMPQISASGDVDGIRRNGAAPIREARAAIRHFRITLIASAVAFLFAVATAVLAWTLPAAEVNTVTVTFSDNTYSATSVCGSLVKSADSKKVVSVETNDVVHTYDLTHVGSIVPGAC